MSSRKGDVGTVPTGGGRNACAKLAITFLVAEVARDFGRNFCGWLKRLMKLVTVF
ncbi:hypothetical protein [Fuerstiella marisgermanici]|uniref:hypothetical protein n=1 Tax=Fuerstiella marisgermanici TaxID=1891926 RepID=UPI001C54E171|nr:hypothetical protein [Fuerstiella marisgermanici]